MDGKKDSNGADTKNNIILHKKNALSVFLNKKTEKIAAAVYLLTDLHSPSDPLRIDLRSSALELLGATLAGDDTGKESMARLARKLLSLLQVGYYSRLISDMNHSVFRREIEALIGHIEGRFSRAGEVALSSVFFQVDSLSQESEVSEKTSAINKGHLSNMSFKKSPSNTAKDFKIPSEILSANRSESDKNKRHEEVMDFFRTVKKSDVTIKDISSVMKDCSEKTIQRELVNSVQKGLLRKEGERRWSRYFLVG